MFVMTVYFKQMKGCYSGDAQTGPEQWVHGLMCMSGSVWVCLSTVQGVSLPSMDGAWSWAAYSMSLKA